jgi:hypothetical protein
MRQPGQDVACEQVGFGGVPIAGQDKRFDPQRAIGVELGEHLVGIAYDYGTAAGVRAADTGPEIVLGIAVAGGRLA